MHQAVSMFSLFNMQHALVYTRFNYINKEVLLKLEFLAPMEAVRFSLGGGEGEGLSEN